MLGQDAEPVLQPAFLDCGAHSVDTGALDFLPTEAYTKWVCEHHPHFQFVAAPDDIGNSQQTEINTLQFAKDVQGKVPTSKILPIYHLEARSESEFLRMLEYSKDLGVTRIAIGGALGTDKFGRRLPKDAKWAALDMIFGHLPRNQLQVHLLGMTSPDIVNYFQPESVDSSRYIWEGKVMKMSWYDMAFTKVEPGPRLHQLPSEDTLRICAARLWSPMLRYLMPDYIKSEEDVYEGIAHHPLASLLCLVNGLYVCAFEKHVRDNYNSEFRHYVTVTLGMVKATGGLVEELYRTMWLERALVSYASFYGRASDSVDKHLALFGRTE